VYLMKRHNIGRATRGAGLLLPMILACSAGAQTAVNVVTGQYDNFRSGANTSETILTPANVAAATFGMLFAQPD
jgi:hypothetical protein